MRTAEQAPAALTFPALGAASERVNVTLARTTDRAGIAPGIRHIEIDVTRGLLVLLMISSHVVTLLALPSDSFFRSSLWLPRGWATTGFPMLTGFVIAVVCANGRERTRLLRSRAWRLLVVLMASNVLFTGVKSAFFGRTADLLDPTWWTDVLLLRTESISVYMLPSTLALFAAPGLVAIRRHLSQRWMTAGLILSFIGAWGLHGAGGTVGASPWLTALFGNRVAGIPLLPLTCNAAVGFLAGSLWHRYRSKLLEHFSVPWLALVSLVALATLVPPDVALAQRTIAPVLRFLIVLALGTILAHTPENGPGKLFVLVGRYSLLAFMTHRALIHVVGAAIAHLAVAPASQYMLLAASNVAGIACVCVLRETHPSIDRLCRSCLL
jgi:hypothetical protein